MIFANEIKRLALVGRLTPAEAFELSREDAQNRRLAQLIHRASKAKPSRVGLKAEKRMRAQQVTSCKICHASWPHLTKSAKSLHGLRLLARRGTRKRQEILRAGHPGGWGEKFRIMGRAAMAVKYTARRVAIFKEVAPRAFELLGQDAVEQLINERKRRFAHHCTDRAGLKSYDNMYLFRRFAATHYGGVRLKKPWVTPPPSKRHYYEE